MPAGDDELMTDDEFERLLDTLQDGRSAEPEPVASDGASALAIDSLVVDAVDEWLPRIKEAVGRDAAAIEIDLGALTTIDTAGLQLLLAADASARRAGKTIGYRDPSTTFVQAAVAAGLTGTFGIADDAGGAAGG